MRLLQPVVWTKGTLLTPQHLQAQDNFIENTLDFHMHSLVFRPWGFTQLSIDQRALEGGTCSLTRAVGILPDGLLFDIPDSDAAPAPKSLLGSFEPGQDSLDLFLAIPNRNERGLNVSTTAKGAQTRYVAEVITVPDENSGSAEKPIRVARKNFAILEGQEALEGRSSLQVAQVLRKRSGTYELNPRFIPPILDISVSNYLTEMNRKWLEILSAKSTELSAFRREKNRSLADFTASDIPGFWLLYTINSHLPLLHHFFAAKTGHPERLFSAMLSLAGALTTLSGKIYPRDLPTYDHDNLSKCFSDLDEKIGLLTEFERGNFVSLALKKVGNWTYQAPLDDKLLSARMYLAVAAEMNQGELIAKAPKLKLGSGSRIEELIRLALPGVTLTYIAEPPSAIPMKLSYSYFTVSQSGPEWDSICRSRTIATYVPADFPNPRLELVLVLPSKP